jgi:Ribonuclease G/E
MFETISSQIKMFERIYNGIEEAFIDVEKIRKVKNGFLCTITIHEDDFSNKTVYKDILYPLKVSKQI